MEAVTADSFFNGRIRVFQPRNGYRFSLDALLLASHVCPGPRETILDLGTGVGIIPLILAHRYPKNRIFGIELQPELARLAVRNVEENELTDRISIRLGDMKSMDAAWTGGAVDWVVCNPPYRLPLSGRTNPNRQKAVARHEIKVNLAEVVGTACRMLQVSGKFATIYPAERLADLVAAMRSAGIEPKHLRTIHSRRETAAKLLLITGKKGGRPGMRIAPALIIYASDCTSNEPDYTPEVKAMFDR